MAIKKHPDSAGFQNSTFTAVPGKGYVDETLDHRIPYVFPCVWDSALLEPVLLEIPKGFLNEYSWLDERYDYAGGTNVIYMGKNLTHNAAQAAVTWYVWKFTWDASNNCTRKEGPLVGSWAGRAALGWG